jgi:hypothetical protein
MLLPATRAPESDVHDRTPIGQSGERVGQRHLAATQQGATEFKVHRHRMRERLHKLDSPFVVHSRHTVDHA